MRVSQLSVLAISFLGITAGRGFEGTLRAVGAEAVEGRRTAADAVDSKPRPLPKTDAEWKKRLSGEQYYVLRRKGTERAFTGKYWKTKTPGVYRCAGCEQPLFGSDAKFESGTGWPSYWRPFDPAAVKTRADNSHSMRRVEVVCSRCGGHLGHVFPDGPPPTGQRYCINSAALTLDESRPPSSDASRPQP